MPLTLLPKACPHGEVPWEAANPTKIVRSSFLTVREKGPVGIEMVKRRVQTRLGRKRTGPEEWLVVTRCPLADDRTLEGQASPDATEHDGRYRYQYYLTPTRVSES